MNDKEYFCGPAIKKDSLIQFALGGSVWRPPVMNLYTAGMPDELVEEEDAKENIRGTLSNKLVVYTLIFVNSLYYRKFFQIMIFFIFK